MSEEAPSRTETEARLMEGPLGRAFAAALRRSKIQRVWAAEFAGAVPRRVEARKPVASRRSTVELRAELARSKTERKLGHD